MISYEVIQKNEGLLWSKAFESSSLAENSIATIDRENPGNPNFNQLFFWGEDSQKEEIASLYQKEFFKVNSCTGHIRKPVNDKNILSEGEETYVAGMVSKTFSGIDKIEYYNSLSDNPEFLDIFKEAFELPNDFVKSFQSRMESISKKIEAEYFISYLGGSAACCGSIYKSEDVWFLMNVGVRKSMQRQGVALATISSVGEKSGENIAYRTSVPTLRASLPKKLGLIKVADTEVSAL